MLSDWNSLSLLDSVDTVRERVAPASFATLGCALPLLGMVGGGGMSVRPGRWVVVTGRFSPEGCLCLAAVVA